MSTENAAESEYYSLGERFCYLRQKSGLSMSKFGDSIKVSSGYINDIEKGKRTNVSSHVILLTSKIYLVNFVWLLTGNGQKRYPSNIQKIIGDQHLENSSGEDIHMLGIQMLEVVEEITRLKVRIENLEAQLLGQQKKNRKGK
jgi:transcriptional regulator with XRE-family HTH domain